MTNPSPNGTHRVSRRRFCRRAAATAAGTLAAGALVNRSPHRAAEPAKDARPAKYIDAHVHLAQPWSERGPLPPEMMLRWMDEHEISAAVVLPLISPEAWYYPISTDWVLQQTRPHRDRLIPFCDVEPRTNYLRGVKGILDILMRYVDAGAKGLGEHKCGVAIDDPRNLDVFRAAGELELPVLFHMDNIRNTDRPGLPGLEKVLREVPNSNFIGHAPGFWASISGDANQADLCGYPRGPVSPGGALDRLMEKYPNLYGEFSAGSGANAVRRDPEFGRKFLIRRADRLLFGTDYLTPGQKIPQFELFDEFDLPAEVEAKIYRQNAARLLGLA